MKNVTLLAVVALLSATVGCTSQTEPSTEQSGRQTASVSGQPADPAPAPTTASAPASPPVAACTPLPPQTGSANPASAYCVALGYQLAGEQCTFPDATSCEEWAFHRGECGQTHSFCELHGGTVANAIEDMGGWTASYALCTLPSGKQCHEDAFAHSCTCE